MTDNYNEEIQTNLKYLNIEIELIANPKIPWSAKALFSLIYLLDDEKKGCWAANPYLASRLLLSSQTVSNHIQLLAEYQYIITKGRNEKRIIRINPAYKEIYKPLIRKFISINKESNKNTFYTKKLKDISKGNVVDYKEPKKELKQNPLIDYWNELPNTQKHISRTTKTYKKITGILNQLKSGVFTERNKLASSFLKNNNITNGLLIKQYSVSELRDGLLRLSNMLTEGYWPPNKENLSKSLLVLLYNSETNSSMFLMVMNKKPEQLSKSKSRRPTDKNKDMTESLLEKDLIDVGNTSNSDLRKLFRGLQEIKDFHAEMPDDSNGNVGHRYSMPHQLLDDYLRWIDVEGWVDFSISIMNPNNKVWNKFVKWSEDNLGAKLQ